jgi:hypothetical protein
MINYIIIQRILFFNFLNILFFFNNIYVFSLSREAAEVIK